MIVNLAQLTDAAGIVRKRKRPQVIHSEGVVVNAAQLDAAARLLREADPTVCNGIADERPGFIERRDQAEPHVLVFRLGILPSTLYEITRDGRVTSPVSSLEHCPATQKEKR